MTEFGAGPKFAIYSVICFSVMFALSRFFTPIFTITVAHKSTIVWVGILLIVVGIPFYLLSIVPVIRAFKAKRLLTTGTYGMCRHPVYSAWIVFFVPGIALLLNSWALLAAPIVMYFIAVALVNQEDSYLEETFGNEYISYRNRVPSIIPYGRFTGST